MKISFIVQNSIISLYLEFKKWCDPFTLSYFRLNYIFRLSNVTANTGNEELAISKNFKCNTEWNFLSVTQSLNCTKDATGSITQRAEVQSYKFARIRYESRNKQNLTSVISSEVQLQADSIT